MPTSVVILTLFLAYVSAQNPNCDFAQNVQVNLSYPIESPNYPRNYGPNIQCRWIATCPSGYNCRLDCPTIELPSSPSCSMDRLLISRSGDPQLTGAEQYCGRGSVSAVSTGQRISIGLITAQNSPGGRFSCRVYAERVPPVNPPGQCRCGYKKSSRIVGGVETGVNEFPMMAGLAYVDTYTISCGAVIIDERYVLTAAHCVANQSVQNVAVIVGEHDINTGDSPATQGIRAASFIIHPRFTLATYDYDIAIVRLQQNIVFSDRVGPVCLPFKFANTDLTNQYVTMLGWGTQFPGGPTSNVLMKVDVQVISQSTCRSSINSLLTDRMICTLTRGKDSCQDDSGGPALFTDPVTGFLFNIGIISHGQSCASGYPGISTRVTNTELLQWIVSSTHNNYCRK